MTIYLLREEVSCSDFTRFFSLYVTPLVSTALHFLSDLLNDTIHKTFPSFFLTEKFQTSQVNSLKRDGDNYVVRAIVFPLIRSVGIIIFRGLQMRGLLEKASN